MADAKQKPGVMLYFDSIRPALNRLDNEQCGALFRAILDYGEFGTVSDLEPMTGMVFDLLRPKIDRDAEKYEESREQRQHAVYAREAKRRGEQPLTFSEWRLHRELSSDNRPIPPDNENIGPYPSTTTSTSITQTPTPTTSTSTSTTRARKGTREGGEGEEEGKPEQLYSQWLNALESGNMERGLTISNELYRLGFDVDLRTKELKRRQ